MPQDPFAQYKVQPPAAPPPAVADPFAQYKVPTPASVPTVNLGAGATPPNTSFGNTLSDFFGEATSSINPVKWITGLADLISNTGYRTPSKDEINANADAMQKRMEEIGQHAEKGEYAPALRGLSKFVIPGIPLFGPRIEQAADAFEKGHTATGMGILTDLGVGAALPALTEAAPKGVPLRRPLMQPVAGETAAALDSARAAGVRIPLAAATDNPMARAAEGLVSHTSFLGAETAAAARAAESEGMRSWAGVLADRTAPGTGPLSSITAGEQILGEVGAVKGAALTKEAELAAEAARVSKLRGERLATSVGSGGPADVAPRVAAGDKTLQTASARRQSLNAIADGAYAKVRDAEETIKRNVGVAQGNVVSNVSPFPVKASEAQGMLQPIYDAYKADIERLGAAALADPARAKAFGIISKFMEADGVLPLSTADRMLSDLKRVTRTADSQATRNAAQGTASAAVRALEGEVQKAVAKAPPEIKQALGVGRAATKAKYAVQDLLDNLEGGNRGEPARVSNKLLGARDENLRLLQDVQKWAPEAVPQLGRALLDELVDLHATNPAKAQAKLAQLGPQSRQVLWGEKRAAVESFFRPGPAGRPSVAEQFKDLPTEPAKVLTSDMMKGDAGIKKLDALLDVVGPDRGRILGRGLVEDLAEQAMGSHDTLTKDPVGAAKRQWDAIGPRTKARLIQDPTLIRELDHFWTVADRLASRPVQVGNMAQSLAAASHLMKVPLLLSGDSLLALKSLGVQEVTGKTLATWLNSPAGVRSLTQSLTLPVASPARAAAYANLARLAGAGTNTSKESPNGR